MTVFGALTLLRHRQNVQDTESRNTVAVRWYLADRIAAIVVRNRRGLLNPAIVKIVLTGPPGGYTGKHRIFPNKFCHGKEVMRDLPLSGMACNRY